jgi:hypothetical protein
MSDIIAADFDIPVGHIVFRSGNRVAIQRADFFIAQIGRRLAADPGDVDLQLQALKRVMPDATDEDIATMTGAVIDAVLLQARTGIPEAEQVLGESLGADLGNGSPDSPPGTPTPTSATASLSSTG